ncbi:MAG: glycoside hydrolase family 3 N-terminal domain-containing protein [Actinomycetota bacterium]
MKHLRCLLAFTLASSMASCSTTQEQRPTSKSTSSRSTTTAPSTMTPTTSGTDPATKDPAEAALETLTLRQRIGQLIMIGVPAPSTTLDPDITAALRDGSIGNVMLTGRDERGSRAIATLTTRITAAGRVLPLVATDQEGGAVQVLRGKGFSAIPSAVEQSRWSTDALRKQSTAWGRQLRSSGITMNLAPVADVVPRSIESQNAPIGAFNRHYRATTNTGAHSAAYAAGMGDANVLATAKHFPGLGQVTANTDTAAAVSDQRTTITSPSVAAFANLINAGIPVIMMSSAVYEVIDPTEPACFSAEVITGLLRGKLGFTGVVISDDLGQARQVSRWPPGYRAVEFVAAGGDVVLTVDSNVADAMTNALMTQAEDDPTFRRQIDDAALRVLRAKDSVGLIGTNR